ncbi:L-cystine transport system permease protein TcyB [bioreactor metagenome]|uniref:L-cystine transport system permease protein TcyB n=1 Tax=bioreactor metagenome TaxID=1076179 RepID=A0A645HFI5_9ZZZZ|nr:amino acid ABC transporter permease [Candidatus Pelethousia sp.]NCB30226.1 amino acid ABC transporter permease [Clostridia bacterium]
MSFISVTLRLLQGFYLTFEIFLITLVCALPLGLLIAFCSMSAFKPLRYISKTFVWIIRSTPLMLQVILVFYGPGLIWGWDAMGRTEAVLVAFVINYAAYFSEIYRGGIESIPRGQYEAGQVLGMTKTQIFFKVILLQVVKRIVPPMGNEIITLAKDTSLARIIAVKELIMMAQEYIATYAIIWPLFYSMIFYLVFCGLLTLLLGYTERKLSYFRV